VTPDREYARTEGLGIPGGYRIIVHAVPLEHVWWDVNSVAEFGYDDGNDYAYRNTLNNRKLMDTIVRDDEGNIILPSQRFKYRNYTLYQKGDPLLRSYLRWEPEITSTGVIKGAPEWVKNRKDFNRMMHDMRKYLHEGASGRYWYEESAEAVWKMMRGDSDKAKKFIQLLAIYSPNNNVPNNTLMAIRAYAHWAAGLPEDELSSGMGELDEKARRALYHDEEWDGRKTNSFYTNLMYELVRKYPNEFPDMEISDVATMDLWMARAFGYLVEAFSDDKGTGKYSFSENITRRLTAEMNAKLLPGEEPWTPHQVQAAIWSSMKTRYEMPHVKEATNKESLRRGYSKLDAKGRVINPSSGETEKLHKQLWRKYATTKAGTSDVVTKAVEENGFSFSEAIYDSSQIVTWEAVPSASIGAAINRADKDVKMAFTREALSLIIDAEGNDLLGARLGVPVNYSKQADGAYEKSVTPNVVTSLFPARVKGESISYDAVRDYARAIQYIFMQDAVPFFRPNSMPLVSKAAKEELQFKVVRYDRDRDGRITKVTTIPKSKADTQSEAEEFAKAYLENHKEILPENIAVHGGKYARGMIISFKNKLDDGILEDVLGGLVEYIGDDAGFTRTTENQIIVNNYRDDFSHAPWMHDEDFLKAVDLFIEDQGDTFGITDSVSIYTEGEYGETYDWSEGRRQGTEEALKRSFAGRPDLQEWLDDRRAHFEAILERYSGSDPAASEGGQSLVRESGQAYYGSFEGNPLVKHDLGEDYGRENLAELAESIDGDLDQIRPVTVGKDQGSDAGRPTRNLKLGLGDDAVLAAKGWSVLGDDPHLWGYDGTEQSPTVDGDWKQFRKIDFKGTRVKGARQLAKLFSIYRNPRVEYFHVILTKRRANGVVEIVGNHAMSLGLPGFASAIPKDFPQDIITLMDQSGANEYYLLHNHPSGNIKPSVPDYNVTKRYIKEVPGFKGHIILDHDKAEFIDKKIFRQTFDFSQEGGYHHVPMLEIKHIFSPLSPAEVAKYALGSMTERSSLVMYVNTQLEVVETEATDIVDMKKIFEKIKKNSYSWFMLATKDRNVFDDVFNAQINLARSMAGYFTKDIILLNSDGTYESVADSSFVFQREDTSWLGREMERKYKSGNAREFVFEGPTLYQLSEEAKRNVLDRRKEEVRRAVEEFYWIPDEILEEYSGEEWADREIKFRERLKEFPHLLSTAKEYVDPEEYLAYMESEIGPINAEDEEFYRRVFEYSRIMTPEEKDAQFTRLHTGTDRALVSLGKTLKGYLDVDQKLGKIVHRWGSFRGVSAFVKQLNEESSDEDIQKARALVQQNPRPYRRALQYIEQAQDRVRVHRGEIPNGYADRDAFYDSIGEDIQDALDSPIDYDDMADREVADPLRTSADARENLASHSDVLTLEREADAELKTLGAEAERDVKEVQKALKRAQDELAKARKALEAQGDTLRALEEERKREGSPSQLKKELEERRARVKELRSQLTEANEQVRKLTPRVEALEKREAARRLRDAIERLQKKIREKATFRSDTLDASYEPMFNAIIRLFGESIRPVDLPEQMGQYLDGQLLGMIMHGKPIGEWSLADLQKMLGGIHLMRLDARVLYERRVLDRQNRLQNIAVELYRQSYGENPEIRPGYRTVTGDILDDLTLKRDQYQENLFTAVFNTIKASIGKMQRIARMLDGDKEGVLYNLLVRKAYENQSEELRRSLARLQAADEKMNELGIDNKYLAKDAYTYKTYAGQEKTLSRGEVIGLYVYQQNPIGLQKLVHNRGNGISLMQINEAIATLTDKDKMWGDFMIDTLGGDDTWVRMRDVYYEVYNKNLGRRPRYFTFVADGVEDEGNMDIINGAMRDSMRWVDKGMTKPVNVHAIYPLKLNVTQTFSSQIKRQEHFIQWAGWVRDMNYLMARGTVGQNIRMRFGKKYYDQVLEYIKDVGSPQSIMDDIEKLGSKIVSNAAVAALSLNALTMLKQLPSFASAVRGDIGAVELLQVSLRLINPKTHKEAVEFVNEMSPYMRKRAISVEVEKYQATEFDNAFSSWVQEFNEKVGMRGIQMMDHAAVYTLWLAAYDTYIRRNPKNLSGDALKSEAAFRATQLISETQPSSIVNDLSGIQRKKNPWVRTALLFSNQLFQYINMVWYDLPTSWKNYQATKDSAELRKMFGIVTNMAISGALIILVSGAAIRKDGEDDDDYWKRLRNEVLSMVASYTMPYIGGMVSQGMSGFYGGDLVDLPSALGRMLATDWTDWDAMNKRIWDMLDGVGSTQGLPTAFINRSVKAVKGRNPFELLGVNYGRLWERL
ncbi:MAG: hypothetical protein EOM68_06980, partial [Spirochaetia bacterium]|nr:hypothetical protein [Spirochaetia bacterium]